ncbi:unnamed protein product, partial [marine sediment metagenome]
LKNMRTKIHKTADVQTKTIGKGTIVWQFCIILPDAKIGKKCNINAHCFIENNVTIGNNVTIKCGVYLWDEIDIEDDVFIGPNATFVNNLTPRSKKYPEKHIPILVKKGATVGANSTILGRITLCEYCMIGAGSIVTKNVPNNTLWVGSPAKQVGFVCNCGNISSFMYDLGIRILL